MEAAQEHVFSGSCSDPCVFFPLAAFEGVGENSRLGFKRRNPAPRQGSAWSNSARALGIDGALLQVHVGSRYTGKERDSESGLDNFGARYDASSMGRFMSPDWSSSPEPVPYATRDDPQSLNLYTYARNNPVTLTDPDGHCWGWIQWLCDTGQRFYYAFTDFGFVTHAQVDAIKRQYLIDQRAEINGEQRDYTKATDKQVEEDYDKVMDAIHNHTANQFPLTPGEGGTSPNQMQQQVSRGQAPDSVDRVDSPRFPNEKPHIEFKDGNALNKDGTWKHGGRDLTNAEKEWITDNGWSLPKQ